MEIKQEQREVIDFNNGNILVSASAGSGKTFTMIERAVRLVLSGDAKISGILAVTFTETAAFDMKRKLREALVEKINEDIDLSKRQFLLEQIADLDYADICTLHSFASRLIRKYFYKVNISPDYNICDENEAKLIQNECIDKTFKSLYDCKEEWFLSLCSIFSVKRKDIEFKKLILSLYEFCSNEGEVEQFILNLKDRYTLEGIKNTNIEYKKIIDRELNGVKTRGENILSLIKGNEDFDKQTLFLEGLLSDINKILSGDSIYVLNEFKEYKRDLTFRNKSNPFSQKVGGDIKDIRDRIKEIIIDNLENITTEEQDIKRTLESGKIVDGLVKILLAFIKTYDEEKREENILDFSDLEHFAVKILRDGEINKEIKSKYKYIFADEYQDINGVQEKILSLIGDNNLFMVGDLKQSIYGFRGCNSDIFEKKYNDMKKCGQKTAMLNYNFRSSKKVIEMVNEVFTFCMKKDLFNIDYKESALKEGGVYEEKAEGRAQLHLLVKGKKQEEKKTEKPKIYNILEHLKNEDLEEDNYSALVTKLIKEERGKQYYDFKQKKYRDILSSDIAILVRSTKKEFVYRLVKGLNKRGIKTVSNVAENVCDFAEVKILIELIKAIDCLKNDIPLAMTMLGFIGGFTEQELLEIVSFSKLENEKKYNNFYEAVFFYRQNGSDLSLKEKVERHITYLQKIRNYCDFNGVYDTLLKVLEDNNYKDILLCDEDGEEKVRRVERFISASKTPTKKYTVKEFLYKIENSPDSFLLASPADENCVKIITMHSSKGLEFPVVIVCCSQRDISTRDEREEILQERNIGLGVRFYNKETKIIENTPIYGLIKEQLGINRVKEELRLFYVALTRAKYSLHVVFSGEDDRKDEFLSAKKFLDYIPKSIPMTEHVNNEFTMENLREENRKVIIGKEDKEEAQKIKDNFSFIYPYNSDIDISLKDNVTKVVSASETDDDYTFIKGDNNTNKERGTLAHKIVENVDFSCDFDSEIERLIKENIVDENAKKEIDISRIKKALDNDIFKSLKGKDLYKEKCFTVNIPASILYDTDSREEVLIQGIIDLLVIDGDNAEIIDYKYSSLDSKSLKEKYNRQLELYAYAVEKVLKKKVVKKVLVNIYTGEIVLD